MLLMNARDDVVVLVAAVAERLGAEGGLGVGEGDHAAASRRGRARARATATSRLVRTWRPSPLAWPARCSRASSSAVGALGLEAPLAGGRAAASGSSGWRRNSVERLTAAAG